MKITKAQIKQIIREELTKIMKEDTFHHEEEHDDTDVAHLEDIRREINRHIDNLTRQHDSAAGRHEWGEEHGYE